MQNFIVLTVCMLVNVSAALAHNEIAGKVLDKNSGSPIDGVYIKIMNAENRSVYSDKYGRFEFKYIKPGKYFLEFAALGYLSSVDTVHVSEGETCFITKYLHEEVLQLPEVIVTPREEFSNTTFSALDFKLRPHNSTQELLRIVPGLFIAQHSGGGKAEQLFLRGFDIDHGTDVAISVDGMPVNMVSHAHGQGYADLHFILPETIEDLTFSKGSYDVAVGDFNTAGSVQFKTKNYIDKNVAKYEAGSFNSHRAMALLQLIPYRDTAHSGHNIYAGGEYFFSRSYFDKPQNLNRFNAIAKYNGAISHHSNLSVSISSFVSRWDASGQIPQRAVDRNTVSWYGAIDPTEGGKTSRSNANATLTTYLHNSSVISQQIYFTDYRFDLYSNFTFFKEDSLLGDQIRQFEHRHLIGYNGSYKNQGRLGNKLFTFTAGLGLRIDRINNIGLTHTSRRNFINEVARGDIRETNWNSFLKFDFNLSEKLTFNAGLRGDAFVFTYKNKIQNSILTSKIKGVLSPKLNVYYKIASQVQLYVSTGYGFHSNDARVAVLRRDTTSLPQSKSLDIGSNFKIRKKMLVHTALWYMFLESEYTYVGDDGFIEPSGKTQRAGADLSLRYQWLPWLFADADLTYSLARFTDLPDKKNYIPLAPAFTGVGGLGINSKNGWTATLRFRYLGDRPANEDYSVSAEGYFLMDALLGYQKKQWQVTVSAENIFNARWKEAQFATESQLQNETIPVTENHFTPGAPLYIKAVIAFLF